MSKTYITKLEFGFPDGWVADGTKSILWEDYFVFPYVGKKYNDNNNGWLGNGYMCKWPEEYPKFFEEVIEENKSNDSFQWTSELQEKYISQLEGQMFQHGLLPKNNRKDFVDSHTPKPQAENKPDRDWEILEYLFVPLSGMARYATVNRDSKYWERAASGDEEFTIHSVKRLSDGEVFSVDEKVKWAHHDCFRIQSFRIGLCNEMFAVDKNDLSYDVLQLVKEHKCKYCGAMTFQPDEECYKAPQPQKEEQRMEVKQERMAVYLDGNKMFTKDELHAACERAFDAARLTHPLAGFKYDRYYDYKNRGK